jgi:phosphohistidine swiveling domain-containing protein
MCTYGSVTRLTYTAVVLTRVHSWRLLVVERNKRKKTCGMIKHADRNQSRRNQKLDFVFSHISGLICTYGSVTNTAAVLTRVHSCRLVVVDRNKIKKTWCMIEHVDCNQSHRNQKLDFVLSHIRILICTYGSVTTTAAVITRVHSCRLVVVDWNKKKKTCGMIKHVDRNQSCRSQKLDFVLSRTHKRIALYLWVGHYYSVRSYKSTLLEACSCRPK